MRSTTKPSANPHLTRDVLGSKNIFEHTTDYLEPQAIRQLTATCRTFNKYSFYQHRDAKLNINDITNEIKKQINELKERYPETLVAIITALPVKVPFSVNYFVKLPESKSQTPTLGEIKQSELQSSDLNCKDLVLQLPDHKTQTPTLSQSSQLGLNHLRVNFEIKLDTPLLSEQQPIEETIIYDAKTSTDRAFAEMLSFQHALWTEDPSSERKDVKDVKTSQRTELPTLSTIKRSIANEINKIDAFLSPHAIPSTLCCFTTTSTCATAGGAIGTASGILAVPVSVPVIAVTCALSYVACEITGCAGFLISGDGCCGACCTYDCNNCCAYAVGKWMQNQMQNSCNLCSWPDFLGCGCGPCSNNTALFASSMGIGGAIGCCSGAACGYVMSEHCYTLCCNGAYSSKITLKYILTELGKQFSQLDAYFQFKYISKKTIATAKMPEEIEAILRPLIQDNLEAHPSTPLLPRSQKR